MGNESSFLSSPPIQMSTIEPLDVPEGEQTAVPGARLPLEQVPVPHSQKFTLTIGPHVWVAAALLVLTALLTWQPNWSSTASEQGDEDSSSRANLKQMPLAAAPPNSKPGADPTGTFTGDFSIQEAFTALFGNYDPQKQSSSVMVENDYDHGAQTDNSTLLLDNPFVQGGVQKHLLVTSTTVAGQDCHVCAAGIGVYVFANRSGNWIPEIIDKEALQFGAWGGAGRAQSVQFGPNIFGFSLVIGDMNQGVDSKNIEFVAPVDNHYRPVLELNLETDNAGACGPSESPPCSQEQSTVSFSQSTHGGFFDIKVTQVDMEHSAQGDTSTNRERVYLFSGDKYVDQMPAPSEGSIQPNDYAIHEAKEATPQSGGSETQDEPQVVNRTSLRQGADATSAAVTSQNTLSLPQEEQLGAQAYQRQQYGDALAHFLAAAKGGNSEACSYLGYMYEFGRGVQVDYAAAAKWFSESIAEGNQAAKVSLEGAQNLLDMQHQQKSTHAPQPQGPTISATSSRAVPNDLNAVSRMRYSKS